MYSFNSKSDTWWEQGKNQFQAYKNVKFYQFNWSEVQELAERSMDWSISISGATIYITTDNQNCILEMRELSF